MLEEFHSKWILWAAIKADSTLRSSQAVPHPSTNRALCHLTSEVGRDPVHWTRYGRQRKTRKIRGPTWQKSSRDGLRDYSITLVAVLQPCRAALSKKGKTAPPNSFTIDWATHVQKNNVRQKRKSKQCNTTWAWQALTCANHKQWSQRQLQKMTPLQIGNPHIHDMTDNCRKGPPYKLATPTSMTWQTIAEKDPLQIGNPPPRIWSRRHVWSQRRTRNKAYLRHNILCSVHVGCRHQ